VLIVAKPKVKRIKRYKKKIEDLINCFDESSMVEKEVFLLPGMIFYLNLGPIEKLTLFAMSKRLCKARRARTTYKDLADDVGCSEERIVEALHVINERLESGEIYRNIALH
jgi:hypothetical protein